MDDDTIISEPGQQDSNPDTIVHGYRLGRLLGRGAQGTVYLATIDGAPETYAIKLVDISSQPESAINRLVRECELTSKLNHPGIVKVYEAGYWGDHIFIAMEVAHGRSVDSFTAGGLGWRRSLDITRRAATALAHAHDVHGIIHRDIKPANLVVDLTGRAITGVKIVDFGLSRSVDDQLVGLTMAGEIMGTPFYMSPEQARGERSLTFHTDLYALGASAFWMIAGQPPFSKGTPMEILVQHCNDPAPNLRSIVRDCPSEVAAVIDLCLAKNPADRFESYGRFIAELEHLIDDMSIPNRNHESSGFRHRAVAAVPAVPGLPALAALPTESAQTPTTQKITRPKPVLSQAVSPTVIRHPGMGGFKVAPRPPKVQAPSLAPGTIIDSNFRVTGSIGAGAMGEVYAVEDCVVKQLLAMKILSNADMKRPAAVRRFQGECTALATVEHRAFPFFAGRGTFFERDYLLMERVKGIDLKTWLETNGGRMGEAGALQVVQQLAHAMHRAHAKCGMVHRDIKPANLMFTYINSEQQVKIVDFGISTYIDYGDFEDFSSRTYRYIDDDGQGRAVGTPAYMSPEQCRGEPPSPFMDIYAIGCTFFHLVTGQTPYQAPNAAMMMIRHMQDEPPTLDGLADVSKGTHYLLKRCLAKNPADRFQNYLQLLDAAKSAYSLTKTTRIFNPKRLIDNR